VHPALMFDPLRRRAGNWSKVLADADDAMALLAVRDLGIFEQLLHGPATLEDLADYASAAPRRLRAFLDVVTAMGFLERADEHGVPMYRLLPADDALFRDPNARNLLPSEDGPTFFGRRARAVEVLTSDRGIDVASSGGDVQADQRRTFLTYLDRHARAEASELASLLDEEPLNHLADLGCGGGTYTAAMLSRWPMATAVLVDRPNARHFVCSQMEEVGLADRTKFVGADLLEASWVDRVERPNVVIISNMLHNIGPDSCAKLIAAAARALIPGGRLVLKDFEVNHDRTGPPGGLRFALLMALCSEGGDLYSTHECAGWADDAGLIPEPPVRLHSAPESFVLVARKPA